MIDRCFSIDTYMMIYVHNGGEAFCFSCFSCLSPLIVVVDECASIAYIRVQTITLNDSLQSSLAVFHNYVLLHDYRRGADYHWDDDYKRDDYHSSRYKTNQGCCYKNWGSINNRSDQAESRQYDWRPKDFRQREEYLDDNRRGRPNDFWRDDRHRLWNTRQNHPRP